MRSIFMDIQECFTACALTPASAYQKPRSCRQATVFAFPLLNTLDGQQEIRGLLHVGGYVDHAGRGDEPAREDGIRCIVRQILARDPMNRCVKVRAGVLAHVEGLPIPGKSATVISRNLKK